MEGSNIGAMLGGITGGVVSLIIVIICMLLINKNGKIKTEYDERQQIVNGKSYKISAITAWVLIAAMILLDMGEIEIPMERGGQYFIVLAISILAKSSYSIWNDAYYGTNTRIKGHCGISNRIISFKCSNFCGFYCERINDREWGYYRYGYVPGSSRNDADYTY